MADQLASQPHGARSRPAVELPFCDPLWVCVRVKQEVLIAGEELLNLLGELVLSQHNTAPGSQAAPAHGSLSNPGKFETGIECSWGGCARR